MSNFLPSLYQISNVQMFKWAKVQNFISLNHQLFKLPFFGCTIFYEQKFAGYFIAIGAAQT
jgi:hypothetical protein